MRSCTRAATVNDEQQLYRWYRDEAFTVDSPHLVDGIAELEQMVRDLSALRP
jgi:hypothetical protein